MNLNGRLSKDALKYYTSLLGSHRWVSSLQTEIPVLGRYAELCDMHGRPVDALGAYQKILRYGKERDLSGWADPNIATDLTTSEPAKIRSRAHIIIGISHHMGNITDMDDMPHHMDRALKAYREVVRQEPDLAIAHYYLAYGLEKVHRDTEAKTEYAKAEKVGGHTFRASIHKRENDTKAWQEATTKTHRIVHISYTGPKTAPRVWSEPTSKQTSGSHNKP